MNQYLHILMINLPMEPESNSLISFFLDLTTFDMLPTDLLFDSIVFGELEETPSQY
jgi:hypothetical protein